MLRKKRLRPQEMDYFAWIAFRAKIERALIQLSLAKRREGPERRLYLNQAKALLLKPLLTEKQDVALLTEARALLIETELLLGNEEGASRLLAQFEEEMESGRVTKSSWLAKIYFEKGTFYQKEGRLEEALASFEKAESSVSDNPLQRLSIWIAEGETLLEMGKLPEAMTTLTRAIDEDLPSSKRLQAMYLRAEVYAREGRSDLALIQLKALSKQQGEWGQKAKEKLAL